MNQKPNQMEWKAGSMQAAARVALVVLILAAAALRFYRLGAQDIWGDEAFSISLSLEPLPQVIAGAADTHPPLYPLFLFFWLRLVGTSAFAARALSVLTGILVVPLVFVFARRLVPDRPAVAWSGALLSAVSPLLIYYSQETRMYELVTLLSLASMYLTLRLVSDSTRDRGRRASQLGYLVTTLLALYTHYYAFFVWAAESVFAAVRWRRERKQRGGAWLREWVLMQLALVAAYVPWVFVQSSFLGGKASGRFDEWGWRGIQMIFGKTFLAFGAGLTVGFPLAQIAAAAFLLLVGLGIAAAVRRRTESLWLAPLCFALPVFIAWLVNPVMPFFFERYVLLALPGFLVTAALGLDWVGRRSRAAAVGAAGVLVIFGALSLSNYYFDDAYAKGKYGQMMAYVESQAQPGDALILNNPLQKPLFDYYRPRGIPAFYFPDGAPLENPATRQQLADVARQYRRLWLVMYGNPAEYDPTGYLQRWLGANAFRTAFRGFVDASLTLYTMPSAGGLGVERPVNATLGDAIELASYDLDRTAASPGQSLELTLHWRVIGKIDRRYTVFTHLIADPSSPTSINPATGSLVWTQMDGEPGGGSRPTNGWHVGEVIDDRYGLLLAPNTLPGNYTIEVGMYDPTTGARLPARDQSGSRVQDDRILLNTVRVDAQQP